MNGWGRGAVLVIAALGLLGCSAPAPPAPPLAPQATGYRPAECSGVTDADVASAARKPLFTKVVVNDAGCFWQENTMIGDFGAGMGISTWWYRGSDLDTERTLERTAGRTLAELSVHGNPGFKAYDDNVCSVYVTKGSDVVTWSIQTLNPSLLPDLCTITGQLAQLSQDRMN